MKFFKKAIITVLILVLVLVGLGVKTFNDTGEFYVLYYDGKRFRKVAKKLAYANGINTSPDSRTVYVAATVE